MGEIDAKLKKSIDISANIKNVKDMEYINDLLLERSRVAESLRKTYTHKTLFLFKFLNDKLFEVIGIYK